MDFESQFGKMQLWIVEHFHLHRKVPKLMKHNVWKNCMLWFITTGTFMWRWVAFCRSDFLQNPYFSQAVEMRLTSAKLNMFTE